MSCKQDRHSASILASKPSVAFSTTSSAASATSAGTSRSGGSKLLFGEIDTSSERCTHTRPTPLVSRKDLTDNEQLLNATHRSATSYSATAVPSSNSGWKTNAANASCHMLLETTLQTYYLRAMTSACGLRRRCSRISA